MDTTKVAALKAQKDAELNTIKNQIQQIEAQMVQLQKNKDQLLTRGIELQGAVRALGELEDAPVASVTPEIVS